MREDAGYAYLRSILNINKRLQQAYVKPWLCHEHEQMFCRDEGHFAKMVDRPWDKGKLVHLDISKEIVRFLSALAWKITSWDFNDGDAPGPQEAFHISWARDALRKSLDEAETLPPFVEHHLYFPPPYEGPKVNVNMLYCGAINATILGSPDCPFTFAGLGGYVAVTLLNSNETTRQGWDGGTRALLGGQLDIRSQAVQDPTYERDIDEIGRQMLIARDQMSERQRALMDLNARDFEQRYPNSKVYIATRKDRENKLRFA